MTPVRRGLTICLLALVALATGSARAEQPSARGELVEVVVSLSQKPLATTRWRAGRQLQTRTLAYAQAGVARSIEDAVPAARIRWRYRLVANGMAVVVPRSQLGRLTSLPGVETVYPSVRYRPQLDRSPQQIGAPALWGPGLVSAGQGMKIAIIDEGIDQTHPFFSPSGYTMPAGYPKGQTDYTTAKVIVARAFPPASPSWKNASKPFDPELSSHGTHVAGIAAGNANTLAQGVRISGVAPRAYLGNYKALTIPTDADVGLDGNSPELVAAIEAAVADGMDVINMSLGEPEIEPSRDIVVKALEAAARAGVVAVVSAGNDFDEFGRGSVGSPAASPSAITVGAVTTSRGGADDVIASFSSSGPTPLSLQLKPDVSAPGAGILSAAPRSSYATLSGTSMAAPHVSGAVALLLQRHPTWTPAQVKSALALTGDPAYTNDVKADEVPTLRGGGGVINLPRADATPLFSSPVSFSFGLIRSNATQTRSVQLTDSGLGGSGPWTVTRRGAEPTRRRHTGRPGHRDRARQARRDRADDAGDRRRGDRLCRAHARHRAAPDPVLVRHRNPGARGHQAGRPAEAGQPQVLDKGRDDARHALPLPGEPGRLRLQSDSPRTRARLPCHALPPGRELRRRRHEPGAGCPGRAPHRSRGRRAPPDRLRRPAVQPESVSAHVRRARARCRHDPACGRRSTTSSSTARRPRAPARSPSATGSTTSRRRRWRCGRGA